VGNEIGGFGEVVFGGYGLEGFVGEPVGEGADGGGIAAKNGAGEGIDLEDG